MTAADSERSRQPSRVIVCGGNRLAHLLVEALVTQFATDVTVILPSVAQSGGPDIAALSNVRIVEAKELTEGAFLAAGIVDATAVALVGSDDVINIHAALRAHELNSDVRLVIRFFNMSLGHRIRDALPRVRRPLRLGDGRAVVRRRRARRARSELRTAAGSDPLRRPARGGRRRPVDLRAGRYERAR